MQAINDFRVVHLNETHSRLLYKENVVQPRITGLEINLQLETDNGYILFVTEGCPFEEGLHIYYLDREFRLRDRKALWRLYRAGVVRDVRWEDKKITFSFFFLMEIGGCWKYMKSAQSCLIAFGLGWASGSYVCDGSQERKHNAQQPRTLPISPARYRRPNARRCQACICGAIRCLAMPQVTVTQRLYRRHVLAQAEGVPAP